MLEVALLALGAFLGFALGSFQAQKAVRASAYSEALAPFLDYIFHEDARSSKERTLAFNRAIARIWTSASRQVVNIMEDVIQMIRDEGGEQVVPRLQDLIIAMRKDIDVHPRDLLGFLAIFRFRGAPRPIDVKHFCFKVHSRS